jgi:hypothetical protein
LIQVGVDVVDVEEALVPVTFLIDIPFLEATLAVEMILSEDAGDSEDGQREEEHGGVRGGGGGGEVKEIIR